ncbi:CocE/NonD family hydrolase [Flavihumibacter fluvii]|uniref:CocE/NonD family hydrolase n=1 Tax=Flavihumibacter fluvii TaxID=2838157 RepID=UPI001BDF108A|nr:CocE/NonD family hydrolase [Flavihumibacter fluvii]ULQ51762.1 CocE/NonD family hydrolase [Flavihumibacter fluvii]
MKNFILSIAIIIFYLSPASAQDIDILSGVKIKLRDGVQLNATVYKPHGQKEALPVILQLTPYISDTYHPRGTYFAKNGYVYAIVDTRGRGSSEGVFDPLMQEAKDGYDIVEWLATQKYCNGKLTMWGGSYSGYNQWATAKELPPHLKTIVPVAAVKPGVDFPIVDNVSYPYVIQWLTYTNGKTGNGLLFNDKSYWTAKFSERFQQDLPFKSLDTLVGNPSAIFQKWITHPAYDDYFKSMSPTPAQYAQINMPILSITGHYDSDQPGALTFYKEFMQYASPSAKNNHFLIIGPWDHAGTRTPKKEVGGLTFGNACLLDMDALHKQWYDFTLKNGAKPEFLQNKVAYFVSNKNTWKYASSLGEIGKDKQSLYLNTTSNGLHNVVQSAILQSNTPQSNAPAEYTYDPLDKTLGSIDFGMTGRPDNYLTDQSLAYGIGNAGVIYHSAPFEKETEVSGFFELKAYIETDVKDVDIRAIVFEVKADGSGVLLTTQTIRARFRDNLEMEKLLKPGEINLFHFNHFPFISRAIEKGSRLRLIISSPNSIFVQKNYCSGGVIANETVKDAHTAHIKVYNDSKHQSVLVLPVVND